MRARLLLVATLVATACGGPSSSTGASAAATPAASLTAASSAPHSPIGSAPAGNLLLVGRIVTLADPPEVEAILIVDGRVTAMGSRRDVEPLAGPGTRIIELGSNVAYPGFIDAHAHWIGDRKIYSVESPAEAMDLAVARGWTSISEQWIDPERLDELTALARDDALRLRVDAYLALNFNKDFFGDWYADREPGPVDDYLRVQGLKIGSDNGAGTIVNWEPGELTATIARANEAGWQVSVHTMSSAALELVLDAFEAALGPSGPNPLHHRIEHAAQVTDEQLARMVALDLAIVIHPDGEPDWIMYDEFLADFDRDNPPADIKAQLGRWRDFADAGLHVAFATDAPWAFPDFELGDQLVDLTPDLGRPFDQIAAGMDGTQRMNPVMPSWLLDQTFTAEQGLRAVTLDAAYALRDEANRGHLAVGTYGDVTILSRDVTLGTPDEIRATRVIATIVGGQAAYCSDVVLCP